MIAPEIMRLNPLAQRGDRFDLLDPARRKPHRKSDNSARRYGRDHKGKNQEPDLVRYAGLRYHHIVDRRE